MERRIEVQLGGMERKVEWMSLGCEACEPDHGTEYVGASLEDVLHAAEMQGLDLTRPFRTLPHFAFGYVEFWQVPSPVPNEAWAQQLALEAAS